MQHSRQPSGLSGCQNKAKLDNAAFPALPVMRLRVEIAIEIACIFSRRRKQRNLRVPGPTAEGHYGRDLATRVTVDCDYTLELFCWCCIDANCTFRIRQARRFRRRTILERTLSYLAGRCYGLLVWSRQLRYARHPHHSIMELSKACKG